MQRNYTAVQSRESILTTNTVLRNTYLLLSLTLLFSTVCAGISMFTNVVFPRGMSGLLLFIAGAYGLMFLTIKLRNSIWGLASIFVFTGFMGVTLGPLLNAVIHGFSNGPQLIMMSLGGTGLVFIGLSAYALSSRKNFSNLAGFITAGIIILLLSMVGSLFFHVPALSLAISAGFILISSCLILFRTSQIIHGGEQNYIVATIGLYIDIYNLFISLLNILAALSGNKK